jgi:hypothetical protein
MVRWMMLMLLLTGVARADVSLTGQVKGTDAQVVKTVQGWRVQTGHAQNWPGIALAAPGGKWDLSKFEAVTAEIKNTGAEAVTIHCRVDNAGADGMSKCNNGSIDLAPGETGTLKVTLVRQSALRDQLFGMRGYPIPSGAAIDPSAITQILFFLIKPKTDQSWQITSLRASGDYHEPGPNFFPLIDTFGQYIHRDWPGKVHSLAELAQHREAERLDLEKNPGPADWDAYGGWKGGPTLKATGFFRTEKVDGKWWLVDPEGHLFFSQGIDDVGSLNSTPVDERDSWFADFPGSRPEFSSFFSIAQCLMGHYAGKNPRCFSFAGANLARKYGPAWKEQIGPVIHARLRSWGINTLGNWSSSSVARLRKTPYTATLGTHARLIEGSSGYWGKFIDPFDPAMANNLERSLQRDPAAGDPWCIGYFVDNEMSWGDDTSLAIAALKSPADQPAKIALVADLKKKYTTIEPLNAAWGTQHASWEALLSSTDAPDKSKAQADLKHLYSLVAEQYFRTVRAAVKKRAPSQLYLGCRFAAVNPQATAAAAKYSDVVSFNIYSKSVAQFRIPSGEDLPVIIGEFHFGALDRGMFHTGLVPVPDQAARGKAYAAYVNGAVKNHSIVGCHWFEYQDEPTTGRAWDEENYQIGFVDIADSPYPETISAAREVGRNMYRERMGR